MDVDESDAGNPPEQKGQYQHQGAGPGQQTDEKPLARLENLF
jgi:hypothetical protein